MGIQRYEVGRPEQVTRLAAALHTLKVRTGRSYEALARRIGVSSSTLHRYCRGETVPASFDPLARFSAVCGAGQDETDALLRLWALASHSAGPVRTPRPRGGWVPAAVVAGALVAVALSRRRRR